MDFTLAQTAAPNPWLRRIGRNTSVDFPNRFYGLSVLPAMNPARANTTIGYNEETSMDEEVAGWVACLTEVAETAPFSEDEIGVPFDNANIRWVRTRVWRQLIADGGGDLEWWTAVPRLLSEEYTAVGRCCLMQNPAVIQDFLGDDPMSQFVWNHRTPTGLLLDTTTPEGLARSQWGPMNLNDRVITAPLIGEIIVIPPGTFPADYYISYPLSTGHVGFRGGKVAATVNHPLFPSAWVYESVYTIAYMDYDEWSSSPWVSGDPPASLITVGTVTVTANFAAGEPSGKVVEVDLPSMDFGHSGKTKFILAYAGPYNEDVSYSLITGSVDFLLSPRTDVPLPYFASQRNRVAPGGIIVPP